MKALVSVFIINRDECEVLYWESKIADCKTLINEFSKRNLTIFGKVTVIKSLLLPKLAYFVQYIFTPKQRLNEINSMLFKFLWNKKPEKIKRSILIGKKLEGGIDMPDF